MRRRRGRGSGCGGVSVPRRADCERIPPFCRDLTLAGLSRMSNDHGCPQSAVALDKSTSRSGTLMNQKSLLQTIRQWRILPQ